MLLLNASWQQVTVAVSSSFWLQIIRFCDSFVILIGNGGEILIGDYNLQG